MPPAVAAPLAPRARPRPAVEGAGIFRAHGAAYRQTHTRARAPRRAMQAIETCRPAALGGPRLTGDTCGAERLASNSCRHRHCPKCQTLAQERWIEARRADVLPVEYCHVVFTLPPTLTALAQGNPRVLSPLLFRTGAATQRAFTAAPLAFAGSTAPLADPATFAAGLHDLRRPAWVVYATRPFAGPPKFWSTSGARPTAWPSPTTASSASPTASCGSAGRTTPTATA